MNILLREQLPVRVVAISTQFGRSEVRGLGQAAAGTNQVGDGHAGFQRIRSGSLDLAVNADDGRGRRCVGQVAGRLISPRAKFLFLLVLFFALTIVLAIFGLVIATFFAGLPSAGRTDRPRALTRAWHPHHQSLQPRGGVPGAGRARPDRTEVGR